MQQDQFLETLRFFLRMPLNATPVLEHFATLPNAQFHDFGGQARFVYIPATRDNAVLLVAHADTVDETDYPTELLEEDDIIRNADSEQILGADDRAGCAMVSILGSMLGHGILITDGEENGQIGAQALMEQCSTVADELQSRYQFMVEFDRRMNRNFKCYNVGTDEFRDYIKTKTNYRDDGRSAYTDICTLARNICGVNLATGFYNEHGSDEYLSKSDWLETLRLAIDWLGEKDLPRFQQ